MSNFAPYTLSIGLLACVIPCLLYADTLKSVPIKAKVYDYSFDQGELEIKVQAETVAKIVLNGADKWIEVPAFNFQTGEKLTISGKLCRQCSMFSFPKKGSVELSSIDFGPLLSILRNTSIPISLTMRKFLEAKIEFEKKNIELLDDTKIYIMIGDKSSELEVNEAEKRLGYSLPEEYREFIKSYGMLMIGDSYFMEAKQINTALQQMEDIWGTPKEELMKLSKDTQEFFKSTVILYTESGDGYGAVLYKPKESDGINGKAGYYYVHQDSISSPELIAANNTSNSSFRDILVWILFADALENYDSGTIPYIFLDSSSSQPLPYILEAESGNGLTFELRVDWDSY